MMISHYKLYRPLSAAIIFLILLVAGSYRIVRAFDAEANHPAAPASAVNISGQVTYCAAAIPPGAPNVTMNLTGSATAMATTDASGNYTFASANLPAGGTYTVTPTKTGAVSGLNTSDVSRVLNFLAGTATLTTCQQTAADTSKNGSINTTDVSHILNFLAGNPPVASNHTGEWVFTPPSNTYVSIVADQTNQNYSAILLGEVTGNWTPAGPTPAELQPVSMQTQSAAAPLAVTVTLPTASVASTVTNFTLPITISNTTGQKIDGYRLRVVYNPAVINITGVDTTGTMSASYSVSVNTSVSGVIQIVAASATQLTGSGTLIKLTVTRVGAQGTSTTLQFQAGGTFPATEFTDSTDDTIVPSTGASGSVTVGAAPTAVKLEEFTATGYGDSVYLTWKTGHEVDSVGFNIYRDDNGKRTRVNSQMIAGSALMAGPGLALQAGRNYAWSDGVSLNRKSHYWLEEIDMSGRSKWYGPVSITDSGRDRAPVDGGRARLLSALGSQSPAGSTQVEARAAMPQASANRLDAQAQAVGQTALKLGIRQEGLYRITQPELIRAGLDPNTDPRLLQLFVDGQQMPLAEVNTAGGRLDTNSAVEFYATGMDSAVTDTRAYWLVVGKEPGLRIQQSKGKAKNKAAAPNFAYTVERRDRSVYFSSLKNGDSENFFGPVITQGQVEQKLALARLDKSGPAAEVEVALQGVSLTAHRVSVEVNGAKVGELTFDGQANRAAKFSVPTALLSDGDNTVTLASLNNQTDVSLVDYVRITYARSFVADNDSLRFIAGKQPITVDGFSTAAIHVFDVTDPANVSEITGKIQSGKSGYAVTLAASGSGRTLIATTETAFRSPDAIAARQSTNLRQELPGTDMVMITRKEFFDSLQPLAELRRAQGLSVALVDVEDIYDSFSFGQKTPQAIKDFMAYARASYKTALRYALIVGDASYDPKNHLGLGNYDMVPSRLIDTAAMETASDEWFAPVGTDGAAQVAIGRLPARTITEAAAMVAKLLRYEQSTPSDSVVLIADQGSDFDFGSVSSELRALAPHATKVEDLRRGMDSDEALKSRLIQALNGGPKLVNYIGHGSVDLWRANLLTDADANALTNQDRLSVYVMMTCLNGYFHDAAIDSLAESLVKSPGGAVAVWSSSGISTPGEQARMNAALYKVLFGDGGAGLTLGEAISRAKLAAADDDVRKTWTLIGDPSMRLR
ncbi:MAG: C25 family cysteine peptidase [Blastocatellia bacterium]